MWEAGIDDREEDEDWSEELFYVLVIRIRMVLSIDRRSKNQGRRIERRLTLEGVWLKANSGMTPRN